MNDDELIKEATETPEWEVIPLIDRPLFVRGYITGAKAKLSELDNQYKNLCKAKEIINNLMLEVKGYEKVNGFDSCELVQEAELFLKENK